MVLAAGTRFAHYEIESAIGSGGMGVVYRARDTRLGREVALKVMAPHIASDPIMRARFETEARAVASLSHPGILSIYELAVADGVPFAVMELLEGRNLRERISKGPLPWREAVDIAAAIADGLAAAHAKGIVHRDLKPENVFLTSDGHVKILDFGLALQRLDVSGPDRPTIARTAQGVVLGTFGYMSPEQVTGESVDGRTDVFALGCLLYEMLTGRQLFTGTTPQEIIARLLHDSVPDLSSFDPLAPQELRAVVARAVQRDPGRRFASAQDMGGALRALLSGTAVRAPRTSRTRGKSLAVLPFVNAAGAELDYLADGITESIINSLSQLGTIRVVPRSLVFRYRGLQADPATVGAALNVRSILTGRVTQHADILNIQAELVDTTSESQLWGEQFRQHTSDLMTVQEEIAWKISEALRLKLTTAQKKQLRKRSTVNPEAYQAYLRGRHHWNQWTPEGFRRALDEFQRAIDLDPLYAVAYAGLGDTYGAMAYYGHLDPRTGFAQARAAADRALQLDPDLPEAHVTLALGAPLRRLGLGGRGGRAETGARAQRQARRRPRRLRALPVECRTLYRVAGRGAHRARSRPAVDLQQHRRRLGASLRRPPPRCDSRGAAHPRSGAWTRRGGQHPDRFLRAARTLRGRRAAGQRAALLGPDPRRREAARRVPRRRRAGILALPTRDDAGSPRQRHGPGCLLRVGHHAPAARRDRSGARRARGDGRCPRRRRRLHRRRPDSPPAAWQPTLRRDHQARGLAHGFSSAYNVDMIGTGTPAAAARRTSAPCSASTSMRFPCDKSISSDDRIVPGIAST